MDDCVELDRFRKSWQDELLTKKTSDDLPSKIDPAADGVAQATVDSSARKEETSSSDSVTFDSTSVVMQEGSEDMSHTCITCEKCLSKKHIDRSKRKMIQNDEWRAPKRHCRNIDDFFSKKRKGVLPTECLLDQLIADIDEMTEIPFFDLSIPREVALKIFQYLGLKDLCSCAQVSRSWSSLADDEYLWCQMCHRLGRERVYATRDKTNWKEIVRHNIERKRTLDINWKGRLGKLSRLDHSKGKILCSVDSCEGIVVAGYTNGEVKCSDLANEVTCIFQPSDTSLHLSRQDEGTVPNTIHKVVTTEKYTAAVFSHGNVDVWSLETGTQPLHTHRPKPKTREFSVQDLSMSSSGQSVAVSYGPFVDTVCWDTGTQGFQVQQHLVTGSMVRHLKFLNTEEISPPLVLAQSSVVSVCCPGQPAGHMTEIHNLSGVSITAVDVQVNPELLAVGLGSHWGIQYGFSIQVYDVSRCCLLQTLRGSAYSVSCVNLADSPPHLLVAGAGESRIHVFDLRQEAAALTLQGHNRRVTAIQMDDWKIVSGDINGFVCVWDQRMATKLWEIHNRHPVRYCHFHDKTFVCANIPDDKFPQIDDFEYSIHRRYRGTVQVYDFLEDLSTQGVPEICLSTYDQPDASKYNIGLAMPYDTLAY